MSGQRLDPAPGFVHQALVYGSDDEFVAVAGRFLRDGAERGEPALVVTYAENIRLLRASGGPGDVEYVDSERWYGSPGATFGAFFRRANGHRGPGRLRMIGEPIWSRGAREVAEWKRNESAVNAAFAETRSWV